MAARDHIGIKRREIVAETLAKSQTKSEQKKNGLKLPAVHGASSNPNALRQRHGSTRTEDDVIAALLRLPRLDRSQHSGRYTEGQRNNHGNEAVEKRKAYSAQEEARDGSGVNTPKRASSSNVMLPLMRRNRRQKPRASAAAKGVRIDSRIGKLLVEFGRETDWASTVILKQQMASILQACVRGWLLRKHWRACPEDVVTELHHRLQEEKQALELKKARKHELEQRLLTNKQKSHAAKIMKAFHVIPSNGHGKWGAIKRNMDIVHDTFKDLRPDSDDSDSDFEDLEMDSLADVKFRSATPPWQTKTPEVRTSKGDERMRERLDLYWDLSRNSELIKELKERRLDRDPDAASRKKKSNGANRDLSPEVVNELLLERYVERYSRLGLSDIMPLNPYKHSKSMAEMLPDLIKSGDEPRIRDRQVVGSSLQYATKALL